MSENEKTVRRLSDQERIKKVQDEKRKNSYQLTMLSIIGVLTALFLWQIAVMLGWRKQICAYAYGCSKIVLYKMGGSKSRRGCVGSTHFRAFSGGIIRFLFSDCNRRAIRIVNGMV